MLEGGFTYCASPFYKGGLKGISKIPIRKYNPNLKNNSRNLRKDLTDAEQLLWSRLRRKQILGIQFYRQKPIGDYIIDFYAPKAGLVIEVDGAQHMESTQAGKDSKRDKFLAAEGLRVLRFNNLEVLKETDAVIEKMFEEIKAFIAERESQ